MVMITNKLQQPLGNWWRNTHFTSVTRGCQGVTASSLRLCDCFAFSDILKKSSKSNLIEMTVKTLNMIFHSKKTQPIATIPLNFTPYFPPGPTV